MKNVLKAFGVIALVAVISFSMAGCKTDDDGGGLSAPSLTASPSGTVSAGTTVYLNWTSVSGALGYTMYANVILGNVSSGWISERTTSTSDVVPTSDYAGYTIQIKVSAYNSNGNGPDSNIVTITVTGGTTQPQPNTSINGVWEYTSSYSTGSSGPSGTPGTQKERVTVSGGDTGRLTRSSNSLLMQDAANKGYLNVGDVYLRNLRSTGNLTWSGQILVIFSLTNTPDIAADAGWANCTITMSSNGTTITIVTTWSYKGSSGTRTSTYTRVQ